MADHQHSNNFLKNLSQKKYAWMEEATAPASPVANASGPAASTQSAQASSSSPDARSKNKDISTTASSSTSKKTKKQKLNTESNHDQASTPASSKSSASKHKKGSSPPPSSSSTTTKREKPGPKPGRKSNAAHLSKMSAPSSPSIATENGSRHVNEENDQPIATFADSMKDQPLFKYTTFPVKGYNILPTRNITSNYAKNDTSYFPGHKTGDEELLPNVSNHFSVLFMRRPTH